MKASIRALAGAVGILISAPTWADVTAVVAIRQALDFDTGKAIATAVISFIIVWVVIGTIMAVIFGGALLAGRIH